MLSSARLAAAQVGALAITLPMLLAGALPASAAVATHAMTPAVDDGILYRYVGADMPSGRVLGGCQAAGACFGPDQIRAAYDIQPVLDSGITGSGRTIVIIDAYSSPTIHSDLAWFDRIWNLPAPPRFKILAPDGVPAFNVADRNQVIWSAEISVDVEWAHAVAPGAAIDLVLARSSQDADMLRATRFAVEHNLGDVISQSFGEAEACADPRLLEQEHALFEAASDRGIALFAASGDFGSGQPTCDGATLFISASTPASDPQVTAVGGTRLAADGVSGAYRSESAWNRSGGGFSSVYSRPGYQAPFNGNERERGLPDVAYDADPNTGVLGTWSVLCGLAFPCPLGVAILRFGGTSAGTPQWAGIAALADQEAGRRLGPINKALYHIAKSDSYGSAFHDVTSGNNGYAGLAGFSAAPGWDAATGLGSPDVAHLLRLLT
ncbi:hypothetical protein EPN29_05250 [bacterium]|nr:MAG: hypothetical protein EPN29_05250 [bacterium]